MKHVLELIPVNNNARYVVLACECGWTGPNYRATDQDNIHDGFNRHVHSHEAANAACPKCNFIGAVLHEPAVSVRCTNCQHVFNPERLRTTVVCESCGRDVFNAEQQTRYVKDRRNPMAITREPAWVCKECIADGVNLAFPAGRRPPTDMEFDIARQRLLDLRGKLE